jgi:Ca2+-binding EF-hand superfamily protein
MSNSDFIEQAIACFLKYDTNGDNFIDPSELKILLTDVHAEAGLPSPSDADVEKVFTDSDVNGDRLISREEFLEIFKKVVALRQNN